LTPSWARRETPQRDRGREIHVLIRHETPGEGKKEGKSRNWGTRIIMEKQKEKTKEQKTPGQWQSPSKVGDNSVRSTPRDHNGGRFKSKSTEVPTERHNVVKKPFPPTRGLTTRGKLGTRKREGERKKDG